MQLKTSQQFYGHSFDEATGQYLMPVRVYPESDGSCPLPHNAVNFPPAEPIGPQQTWRINDARSAWEVVDDFRGVMLYAKATGLPVPNVMALGNALSDDLTTSRPVAIGSNEPLCNQWDASIGAWRLVPDYSRTPLWEKATALPANPLPVGLALPLELTTLPPSHGARSRWDAHEQAWTLE